MPDPAAEKKFQDEIVSHLNAHGWLLGSSDQYDRERALYPGNVRKRIELWQQEAKELTILMDLNQSSALRISPKTIGEAEFLFTEADGFNAKNPVGWKTQFMVLKKAGQ